MEGWRRYADGVVKTYNLYTMLLIPLYGGVPKAGWFIKKNHKMCTK